MGWSYIKEEKHAGKFSLIDSSSVPVGDSFRLKEGGVLLTLLCTMSLISLEHLFRASPTK